MIAGRFMTIARSGLRGRATSQLAARITKNQRWKPRQFVRAISSTSQISPMTLEEQITSCVFEFGEEDEDGT
jgi:hypothetical protein